MYVNIYYAKVIACRKLLSFPLQYSAAGEILFEVLLYYPLFIRFSNYQRKTTIFFLLCISFRSGSSLEVLVMFTDLYCCCALLLISYSSGLTGDPLDLQEGSLALFVRTEPPWTAERPPWLDRGLLA